MTVGRAAFAQIGLPHLPLGVWPLGRHCRNLHFDLQFEMREAVAHDAGRFFQAARNGACASASSGEGNFSPHGPCGGCSMPPSKPFSGRLTSSTAPLASRATNAAPRLQRPRAVWALSPAVSLRCRACAPSQSSASGQLPQAGRLAVQMPAPRSISACAKSPARFCGTSDLPSASSLALAPGSGSVTANSRAITRSALASIAASRASKAMAAIAPAV